MSEGGLSEEAGEVWGRLRCGCGAVAVRGGGGAGRSWWTERARPARVQFSRLLGFYPRGRCWERGYVQQRPRAGRGLSALRIRCGRGAVCSRGVGYSVEDS